jgi:tetratricopeptide (TPR) repeat protein
LAAKRSKPASLLSAFISHAKADEKKARAIAEGLESRGFKCWIAPRDVRVGRSYGDEIIRGIESTRSFVLVLSKASNDSAFVAREVERAVSKKKPIFAVRIANVEPAPSLELFISGTQWIDAFQGGSTHVDRLVNLLAEEEGRAPDRPEAGNDRPAPRWTALPRRRGAHRRRGQGRRFPGQASNRLLTSLRRNPETQARNKCEAVLGDTKSSLAASRQLEPKTSLGDPDFRACEKSSGDDAIAACDRAIDSGKFTGRSLSYLYSDRGFMRMQKGELDLALADLDEAARIDSTNFYAFWNRGAVYTARGDFDRAQQDLTAALALKPDKTSKAQIEEAMNVVLAVVKAAKTEADDPSVITDPSRFWDDQQGVAGSAASSYPTDAMPAFPSAVGPVPAMPAAPSMGPAVIPPPGQ